MAWNRPKEVQSAKCEARSAKNRLRRVCLALGVLCIVVGGATWLLWPEGGRGEGVAAKGRGRIHEVKPAKAKVLPEEKSAKKPKGRPKTVEEAVAQVEEAPKPVMKMRRLSPEEWDRLTNRTFKTGTEQLMSWVFSTTPGDMPMPIPNISEEDRQNLVSILISKNKIAEKDDEKTAFCKEQVDLAKKEMAKYIGDGGDPDDFLQYYFQELKLAFDKRNDAISTLQETGEEDPELAELMRVEINKKFEEQGIKAINKEAIQ